MALPSHLVGCSSHRPVRYQAFDSVEESSDLSGSSVEDDLTLSREALNSRRLAYRLLVSARRLFLQAKELMASGDEEGAMELLAGVEELQGRALELVRRSDELGSRVSYRGGRGGRRYDISAVGDLADTLKTAAVGGGGGDGVLSGLKENLNKFSEGLSSIKDELSNKFSEKMNDPSLIRFKEEVMGKMFKLAEDVKSGKITPEEAERIIRENELPGSIEDFKYELKKLARRMMGDTSYTGEDFAYDFKKKAAKYGGRALDMAKDYSSLVEKHPIVGVGTAAIPLAGTGLMISHAVNQNRIQQTEEENKRLDDELVRLRDIERVAKASRRGVVKNSGGRHRRYDSSLVGDLSSFYDRYPIVTTGALVGTTALGGIGLMDLIHSQRRYNELKRLRDEKAEEVKELRRKLDSL